LSIVWTISMSQRSDVGAAPLTGQATEVGNGEISINETLPSGSADVEFDRAFTAANIQAYILIADQAVLIKTNDATTPDDTIQMQPGRPVVWGKASGYYSCLFTKDVTKLFLTSPQGGRVRFRWLVS